MGPIISGTWGDQHQGCPQSLHQWDFSFWGKSIHFCFSSVDSIIRKIPLLLLIILPLVLGTNMLFIL